MRSMIVVILAMLIGSAVAVASDPFCEGYEEGFKEGYCDGKYSCIAPIPPICPIPNIGEGSYKSGYNRGFKDGLRKQR